VDPLRGPRRAGVAEGDGDRQRGAILKEVGTAVRAQLAEGAYLELVVKVDPGWQRRPRSLQRLGY
jgi:GTPase Era involved in 16S rRNA processing